MSTMPNPISLLDERLADREQLVLLSGQQALVRLALTQKRRDTARGWNTAGFVSGYRGSPLGGLDREFTRAKKALDAHSIVFRPGLNEDLAASSVWGSQQIALQPGARYDGVFGMWYGKGPGVDRSLDAIRHANAAGTHPRGGVLVLAGDDHGAVSSTLPHQSEPDLIACDVPVLAPGGLGELIGYGLLGWAMSRQSGLWVGLKCQTEIIECTTVFDPDASRLTILDLPERTDLAIRWPDGALAQEARLVGKLDAARAFARLNGIDRQVGPATPARVGLVSSGKAWLDLRAALDKLGIDRERAAALGLRLYKVGLVWPLEPEGLQAFAQGLDTILVVEEKRGLIEDQIKSLLFNAPADRRPRVIGKVDESGRPLLPAIGELDPMTVARAVASLLGDATIDAQLDGLVRQTAPGTLTAPAALREPYFCSGCPHSVSTHVPEGSRAMTGIGCHMLATGMDRDTTTFTQMGGEGTPWIGLAPFTDEPHVFVNMGDGTYFHSGLLAIRAAIAAGVNATYKILFNDAVAMTGGQPHDGNLTVDAIVAQMRAEGAVAVAVVAEEPERHIGRLPADVRLEGRDHLDAVQREWRTRKGVTVIVYDQVCAAEKRRRRKRGAFPQPVARAMINPLVCEGCGDCSVQSNCIAVEPLETEFGVKRQINLSSCNADLSCLKGFCPSFVTVEGGTLRPPTTRPVVADARLADLPDPRVPALTKPFAILMAGIGGTGVITVSAILAQAAHFDGHAVLSIDQTGLAQKNGAVTSHVRLAPEASGLHAPRIGAGEADLLLAFDMVTGSSPRVLATAQHGVTQAAVDQHLAPTAAFVRDTTVDLRGTLARTAIDTRVGKGRVAGLDATTLATALVGDAIGANMMLLGFAWQHGLIPVTLASLMRAIEANGAAVAMNKTVFDWGRLAAIDPAAVLATARRDSAPDEAIATDLARLVAHRRAFLTQYQDAAYADRYAALVDVAVRAEKRVRPGSTRLSEAVARNAFKLMAIKDEYEVARLHTETGFLATVDATFAGPTRLKFHLAPPLLSRPDPRTGRPQKRAFGPWILPVLRGLASARRLRFTRWDVFGLTAERRAERALLRDYEAFVEGFPTALHAENFEAATALATLPDSIRGYGPVKAAAMDKADATRETLLAAYRVRPRALAS